MSFFDLMRIYFKGVLSNRYHGGPNDVPNRTEGRDANHQQNRIDIEEAVNGDSEKIFFFKLTFYNCDFMKKLMCKGMG